MDNDTIIPSTERSIPSFDFQTIDQTKMRWGVPEKFDLLFVKWTKDSEYKVIKDCDIWTYSPSGTVMVVKGVNPKTNEVLTMESPYSILYLPKPSYLVK